MNQIAGLGQYGGASGHDGDCNNREMGKSNEKFRAEK